MSKIKASIGVALASGILMSGVGLQAEAKEQVNPSSQTVGQEAKQTLQTKAGEKLVKKAVQHITMQVGDKVKLDYEKMLGHSLDKNTQLSVIHTDDVTISQVTEGNTDYMVGKKQGYLGMELMAVTEDKNGKVTEEIVPIMVTVLDKQSAKPSKLKVADGHTQVGRIPYVIDLQTVYGKSVAGKKVTVKVTDDKKVANEIGDKPNAYPYFQEWKDLGLKKLSETRNVKVQLVEDRFVAVEGLAQGVSTVTITVDGETKNVAPYKVYIGKKVVEDEGDGSHEDSGTLDPDEDDVPPFDENEGDNDGDSEVIGGGATDEPTLDLDKPKPNKPITGGGNNNDDSIAIGGIGAGGGNGGQDDGVLSLNDGKGATSSDTEMTKLPQTGQESTNMSMLMSGFMAIMGGLAGLIFYKRKKTTEQANHE